VVAGRCNRWRTVLGRVVIVVVSHCGEAKRDSREAEAGSVMSRRRTAFFASRSRSRLSGVDASSLEEPFAGLHFVCC